MKSFLSSIALLLFFVNLSSAQVQIRRSMTLMGSVFEITLVDKDSSTANLHIDQAVAEIERIENLISEWRPNTQISRVNQNAGIKAIQVDSEVYDLCKRALYFSQISNGAFDISIAALDKIWRFDGSMEAMPSEAQIQQSVAHVGYQHIILDSTNSSIYLAKAGMKIGFGSIGKGYAADKAREVMKNLNITAGMINASGDIASWGEQLNGEPWTIGVLNPFKAHKMIKVLKFKEHAVATSGSYEKYVEFNDVRYSHIIDPKTGYPSTGLVSATVYGPSAEFANGLSTSVMVLGAKKGIKLAKQFPQYRFILIGDNKKIYR
ncbi:FAD:protein FMN transferase [Sphingobacterium sp. DK4209]|uniref:FAD:protein FMN transferase n=1 Tax=Sphingobacterium zhuxiongii TaxID=2662364 RepID=A0A5Q0QCN1_9SPHI|nr:MULTISPECIES: FAD:protein FMN transferase [unclassified Sphingobacterium]MVZ64630.1 FAD:protein FMN transferase [Sphingobacterium sp. DK4209]QGA26969.1 FAD:protein FMN transferase [Sphingobacterium sp. dk4302]